MELGISEWQALVAPSEGILSISGRPTLPDCLSRALFFLVIAAAVCRRCIIFFRALVIVIRKPCSIYMHNCKHVRMSVF